MNCEIGREPIFGERWPPCNEPASYQMLSPTGNTLLLCAEHFEAFSMQAADQGFELTDAGMAAFMGGTPTGNQITREPLTEDVFILRDPTMAVPELMRCPKCHDFMFEGSRCTFIGHGYHRHLVHASCVGK